MNRIIGTVWPSLLLVLASFCAMEASGTDGTTLAHDHEHDQPADEQAQRGDEPRHDDVLGHRRAGHAEGEPEEIHLSPDQIKVLGIRTERLEPRALGRTLSAPGEVRLNAYASAQVTPRIVAQVTARHARLGDRVETGQPMATLRS